MTQENRIADAYPLSALFINACNLEVTKERIGSLFQVLGIPCQTKLAEMFELSPAKINDLVSTVSAAPAAAAPQPAEKAEEEKEAPKEAPKEEDDEDDEEIDFGSLFG